VRLISTSASDTSPVKAVPQSYTSWSAAEGLIPLMLSLLVPPLPLSKVNESVPFCSITVIFPSYENKFLFSAQKSSLTYKYAEGVKKVQRCKKLSGAILNSIQFFLFSNLGISAFFFWLRKKEISKVR
jgi:hypothetical protein